MIEKQMYFCSICNQQFNDKDACIKHRSKEEEKDMTITDPLTNDPVNHPKHYSGYPAMVECIDVTRHLPLALGNAVKYIWRAGKKDPDAMLQDLEKALWYLQDYEKEGTIKDPDMFIPALSVFNTIQHALVVDDDPMWPKRMSTIEAIVWGAPWDAVDEIEDKIRELKTLKSAKPQEATTVPQGGVTNIQEFIALCEKIRDDTSLPKHVHMWASALLHNFNKGYGVIPTTELEALFSIVNDYDYVRSIIEPRLVLWAKRHEQ